MKNSSARNVRYFGEIPFLDILGSQENWSKQCVILLRRTRSVELSISDLLKYPDSITTGTLIARRKLEIKILSKKKN